MFMAMAMGPEAASSRSSMASSRPASAFCVSEFSAMIFSSTVPLTSSAMASTVPNCTLTLSPRIKPDAPITLNIYTGANGHYSLYNDDGRSYDYEKGKYSTIELNYDDAKGILTIGKRQGEFNGMQQKISMNIRWIGAADGMAKSLTGPIAQSIEYVGEELVVRK